MGKICCLGKKGFQSSCKSSAKLLLLLGSNGSIKKESEKLQSFSKLLKVVAVATEEDIVMVAEAVVEQLLTTA